ncbi:MAG: hypothetical protein HYU36_19120 [Planctomycetes bacterium]|nr:hypothetical protein [Planctomycetota bacterium]
MKFFVRIAPPFGKLRAFGFGGHPMPTPTRMKIKNQDIEPMAAFRALNREEPEFSVSFMD